MGHDGDQPLRPTYRTQKPPWVSLWGEYKGRTNWWTEPDLEDRYAREGKFRHVRFRYKEEDPDWFDPKVPDGTSLATATGIDSTKFPNDAVKGDTPGDLTEWRRNLLANSWQYKAIAEKWDISKEHPGMAINATPASRLVPTDFDRLGTQTPHATDRGRRHEKLPENRPSFYSAIVGGPRFFNKPMNEGCFEKALACAKYAAIWAIPWTVCDIRGNGIPDLTPKHIFGRYARNLPVPCALASAWGLTICTAATVRNKDDVYNHLYASAAVGTVLATIKDSIPLGVTALILTTMGGIFWHYMRISEMGLQGRIYHLGRTGQALSWKLYDQGDIEIPDKRF